ncbi:iron-containing alcohol dehydrogenase [Agitococcus lubricus]|uniref:Alcohol dehydrogenase n=1 Tax=Agitococcus lubricus TaxID=1077255 RepID=A0A2T5IYE1_9GAMM|nr:iron-containing alcohol dehydrogenase [Agitococcus lubricus]PTQ89003.1 alcohol dehydrogenase [Agitococcus lubricus]
MTSLFLTKAKAKAQLVGIKTAMTLIPAPKPTVFSGEGAALKVCQAIAGFGHRHVLVVSDKILNNLGVLAPLTQTLESHGVKATIFDGVLPDPTQSIAVSCLQQYKNAGCDSVLAVGGGSSIDVAKVVALAATNNKTPQQLVGILKGRKASAPLYAVPTTAGTGSEVTAGAVISDDQTHVKGLVIDPKVVPIMVALDSGIMAGMPPKVTAETGLDALTHAVEAFISDFAAQESDLYARSAIKLIVQNLRVAYKEPKNLAAREAMALASHYAGLAINLAGLGYVHAIAHQLGGHYGLPHGLSNAIVLPHVLAFSRPVIDKRLAELARFCQLVPQEASQAVAAQAFMTEVQGLLSDLNIKSVVPNMKTDDFNEIMVAAFSEAHGTYAVPKYMTEQDCQQMLYVISQGA